MKRVEGKRERRGEKEEENKKTDTSMDRTERTGIDRVLGRNERQERMMRKEKGKREVAA